jgi:H/ACA ribonucleoprotein complex subunit 3
MKNLRFCNNCKEYTLELVCKKCKNKSISKYPPRFSPEDRYGKYRRILKRQIMEKL